MKRTFPHEHSKKDARKTWGKVCTKSSQFVHILPCQPEQYVAECDVCKKKDTAKRNMSHSMTPVQVRNNINLKHRHTLPTWTGCVCVFFLCCSFLLGRLYLALRHSTSGDPLQWDTRNVLFRRSCLVRMQVRRKSLHGKDEKSAS